jgi:hypothetical protein
LDCGEHFAHGIAVGAPIRKVAEYLLGMVVMHIALQEEPPENARFVLIGRSAVSAGEHIHLVPSPRQMGGNLLAEEFVATEVMGRIKVGDEKKLHARSAGSSPRPNMV